MRPYNVSIRWDDSSGSFFWTADPWYIQRSCCSTNTNWSRFEALRSESDEVENRSRRLFQNVGYPQRPNRLTRSGLPPRKGPPGTDLQTTGYARRKVHNTIVTIILTVEDQKSYHEESYSRSHHPESNSNIDTSSNGPKTNTLVSKSNRTIHEVLQTCSRRRISCEVCYFWCWRAKCIDWKWGIHYQPRRWGPEFANLCLHVNSYCKDLKTSTLYEKMGLLVHSYNYKHNFVTCVPTSQRSHNLSCLRQHLATNRCNSFRLTYSRSTSYPPSRISTRCSWDHIQKIIHALCVVKT